MVCYVWTTQKQKYFPSLIRAKEFTRGTEFTSEKKTCEFFFLCQTHFFFPLRRSTHYPERLDEVFVLNPGAQRGVDVRKDRPTLRLPAKKHTILFFRLNDNTTCIKLERKFFFSISNSERSFFWVPKETKTPNGLFFEEKKITRVPKINCYF